MEFEGLILCSILVDGRLGFLIEDLTSHFPQLSIGFSVRTLSGILLP